jgi:hypothetical protein
MLDLLGFMLDFAVLYSLKCRGLLPASRQLPGTAAEGPSLRGTMISAKQAYEAAPTLTSREVGDAFVVVEPHVPRPVGCEDLPGLGDESWLRRERGVSEVPASASSMYSWLINPSSVRARLTEAAPRCSGVRCSEIAARIWPTRAPSSRRTDLLPSDEIETGQSESDRARTWRQSP